VSKRVVTLVEFSIPSRRSRVPSSTKRGLYDSWKWER